MKLKHSCTNHRDGSEKLKAALETLQRAGNKLTQPRRSLLATIATYRGPFSAEELHKALLRQSRGARPDLVTVYRSLSTFSELGILGRVDFGDGVSRFEMTGPGGHHHHFVCQGCEKIEALQLCELNLQEKHLEGLGYSRISHRMEFFGYCPDCTANRV